MQDLHRAVLGLAPAEASAPVPQAAVAPTAVAQMAAAQPAATLQPLQALQVKIVNCQWGLVNGEYTYMIYIYI